MPWEVMLNNGEIIKQDESNLSHWRSLADEFKQSGHKIRQISFNNEIVHPGANKYFIFYDAIVIGVIAGPKQHVRLGICGFFEKSNKYKIKWFKLEGNPPVYSEVHKGPIPVEYHDLCIDGA